MSHQSPPAALRLSIAGWAIAALVGCGSAPSPSQTSTGNAPALLDDLGTLHRDTGTRVPGTQRYFDQGLRLAYGFNHEAAGRAFAEAARLDPQCAICLWGQALVLGPNINLPMDPAHAAEATRLSRRAMALSASAQPADRALIEALQHRYADPAPADRKPLDMAYARAMADVVQRFPNDDDAATLYAEALMDLSPWAYWNADGSPSGHTPALVAALEGVLARNPSHIGAIHYYIHAVEASPNPARAERLRIASPTWHPAPAIWCTCPRTLTSASGATTTPRSPTFGPARPTRPFSPSVAAAMASIRWATYRTTGISPR